MVYRTYVEKRCGLDNDAKALLYELQSLLGISNLKSLRIINRYDVENIDFEVFEESKKYVFSEPQVDIVSDDIAYLDDDKVFVTEYLPGQFDQRADSAAQCIQLISCKDKPIVRSAKVYILSGQITDDELNQIKKYVINPVESREASLNLPSTLVVEYDRPEKIKVLDGFTNMSAEEIEAFHASLSLAMDTDDLRVCIEYFKKEGRQPTLTEIKMIDTYWSDHCRHTTFLTTIDDVVCDDPLFERALQEYYAVRKEINRTKPVNLMDLGTIAGRYLKYKGLLDKLDESDEINACTVKIKVSVDGKDEDWLLLFKNETHNHPTEIEPFGGAATCIGGAIRDPLSGRSYVYSAMRVTGAGDPLTPVKDTILGKLPQRKIVTTAAAGYSSYGNQIGLATNIVDEVYDSGYVAKRMEIGAVIGATPAENVRREVPVAGDCVILLGGKTGRDGCGGATGSSKSHTVSSIETCGAEVQKGNAPEERKLQRLFRNPAASKLIKRCNDFGAGGVSVAIGELADGLKINLNAVPKKYEGLDGTELAISESQERMAVVVAEKDVNDFVEMAGMENLESTVVAEVTDDARLQMFWNGDKIVDISREFLNSNGAEKHITVELAAPEKFDKSVSGNFVNDYVDLVSDLNVCSKRGLSERFDSTIGAGTVLMPFGGKCQRTPIQAMVNKIPVLKGETDDCSIMAWGYNPAIAKFSPYHSAYLAVIESVCKLVATGAEFKDVYLTFQEYFEKPKKDPKRWGKPMSALLGAFMAQKELGIAAIGGKDSMSGSFEDIDVPPTLVSFAVTTSKLGQIISNEFKSCSSTVRVLLPEYDTNGLPVVESLISNFKLVSDLVKDGRILSCYTPGYGGIAEAIFKMSIGNNIGFKFASNIKEKDIFAYKYGAFIFETDNQCDVGELLGKTTDEACLIFGADSVSLDKLINPYEDKLESVYHCNIDQGEGRVRKITYNIRDGAKASISIAKPRVLIPVFPGTNCEYDSARAVERAGALPEIFVINNQSSANILQSVDKFASLISNSQAIFIPGGFSGGDEPDGSGKFITAFFRNNKIKDAVENLLNKNDGLMLGICNGFQALIKLGLVPFGKIVDTNINCPTLTFNSIGRHQSKIVQTRVSSVKSPWLLGVEVEDVISVPISHGEGRFVATDSMIQKLVDNGQIATQYVDFAGNPTSNVQFNPNNSMLAVEGITSPDGRVFGKMGHSERISDGLYRNCSGNYDLKLFESLVKYYK